MSRAMIPNSTQIPDIILDYWMPRLSGSEFKVLLYLCRRTYGFGKDGDTISLKQIMTGIVKKDGHILDGGTGLSKETVCSALRSLEEKQLLFRERNEDENYGDTANYYWLNLNPPLVESSENLPPASQKIGHPRVRKPDTGVSNFLTTSRVRKFDPQETEGQETGKQETAATRRGRAKPKSAMEDLTPAAAALVASLVGEGVNRTDAVRLAKELPEECRRQLEYLPFVVEFTSGKGAYLRSAIEQGFGPPKGYAEAQQRSAQAAKRAQAAQAREAAHRQEQEREAALLAVRAKLEQDPTTWARIQAEAEAKLPAPLRGKPSHVAYKPALEGRINKIVADMATGGA